MKAAETKMYQSAYAQWLNDPAISEKDKEELRAISGDEKEIQDRFYTDLSFGTAGLRGVIGIGRNRMNCYVVGRTTQGYANMLLQRADARERGVAIAYDSRLCSDVFALEAALVLCANGIKTYLFETMHSVPQLSFTIGELNCVGGIVITASHNPKQYNGYKVYGENGAQIGPDVADAVTAEIEKVSDFSAVRRMEKQAALDSGQLVMIGKAIDDAYFAYTEALCMDTELWTRAADMPVVYTPLHGTGALSVPRILTDMGLKALYLVEEQLTPDPAFSTVSAPNPEAADALNMAKALAKEKNAALVLATDPDSDRLGVAVRDDEGEYVSLTGNQIGALLFEYIVRRSRETGSMPHSALAVRSIVSTHLIDAIAAKNDIEVREVLTGFRYIGEIVSQCVQEGSDAFLFGFEESFGYLHGTKVRDKDAICAAMLLCECALYHGQQGKTLLHALDDIFEEYGYYLEDVHNYSLYGIEGLEKISQAMSRLRSAPPAALDAIRIQAVRDYQTRQRTDLASGQQSPIDLPTSNVLYYELEDDSWVCVRPSGTEPKLKIYVNSVADSRAASKARCEGILRDLRAELDPILG